MRQGFNAMVAAVFIALVTCLTTARGADLVDRAKLDAMVKPLIDGHWIEGVAIGLVDEKGTQFAGYGHFSQANPEPPAADTIFEIGSISKTFTGLILAKMVEDGTVKLDEPVQNLLGDSIKLPVRDREITLVDLATHTSGLPRMPTNFAPKDETNPYADYTVEQMAKFIGDHKLRRAPGKTSEYSNLGMGLLGHALAVKSGLSYEQLLAKTITEPLDMPDTVITLSDAQKQRLAQPFDFDGQPTSNWDIPTLAGAGAIRSTVNDMTKYLAAQMGLTKTPLAAAIGLSQQTHFENEGQANDLGLAWHIQHKPKMIWHNGGTGGYHTFAGFSPETKQGVVVLANSSTHYVDQVGIQAFALLTTGECKGVDVPMLIELAEADIEPLVGSYELGLGLVAKITRDGNRLFLQLTGQPRIGLYAETKIHFTCRPVPAEFDFEADDSGKIVKMVLHQNGRDLPAKRVEADAEKEPAAKDTPDKQAKDAK